MVVISMSNKNNRNNANEEFCKHSGFLSLPLDNLLLCLTYQTLQ